jgi:hypothetical protein
MAGDGADFDERVPKMPRSNVRNGMHQPVNISLKNSAMFVSMARIDTYTKVDARVQITAPFGRASTKAMTGILM